MCFMSAVCSVLLAMTVSVVSASSKIILFWYTWHIVSALFFFLVKWVHFRWFSTPQWTQCSGLWNTCWFIGTLGIPSNATGKMRYHERVQCLTSGEACTIPLKLSPDQCSSFSTDPFAPTLFFVCLFLVVSLEPQFSFDFSFVFRSHWEVIKILFRGLYIVPEIESGSAAWKQEAYLLYYLPPFALIWPLVHILQSLH